MMSKSRKLCSISIVLRGTIGLIVLCGVVIIVGSTGLNGISAATANDEPLSSESFPQNDSDQDVATPPEADGPSASSDSAESHEEASSVDPVDPSDEEIKGLDSSTLSEFAPLASIVPGTVIPPATWREHTVTRLDGADRYETAASITKHAYPEIADTVIIASGEVFSDALSAAPLSAKLKAPLLLTEGNRLPNSTATEISRLQPSKIIIVGGAGTVQPEVQETLVKLAPTIVRIWGSDRYSTSLELSKYGWPEGATSAFIATGSLFADALSSAAAAAKLGSPVILLPGHDDELPRDVSNELARLGIGNAYVIGGPATVTTAIETALSTSNREVTRVGGKDRFEVSANVTSAVFDGSADVYWASGYAFADALAGAAAAGARGSALMLVDKECVPTSVYSASDQLLPGATTLLGGLGTIGNSVQIGNECMSQPSSVVNSDWKSMQTLYSRVNQTRFEQGVGGLRIVNDVEIGSPQERAIQLANGRVRVGDPVIGQPWVRYQTSAVSAATQNRAQRIFELMRSESGTPRWLYQPNGGMRGALGVGYFTTNGRSGAVLFFGAGI